MGKRSSGSNTRRIILSLRQHIKKLLVLIIQRYHPMALKEMKSICDQIRAKWDVIHIALVHRYDKPYCLLFSFSVELEKFQLVKQV